MPRYQPLIASAVEAFGLAPPVYQFIGAEDTVSDESPAIARCFGRGEHSTAGQCESGASFLCVEVDRGTQLARIPFPDRAAKTVLCFGSLIDGIDADATGHELLRLLEPGGALLVAMPARPIPSTATAAARRGQPKATRGTSMPVRWRRSPQAIERLLRPCGLSLLIWDDGHGRSTMGGSEEMIWGIGFKAPVPGHVLEACGQFSHRIESGQGRLGAPRLALRRLWAHVRRWLAALPLFGATARPVDGVPGPRVAIHLRSTPDDARELLGQCLADRCANSPLDRR